MDLLSFPYFPISFIVAWASASYTLAQIGGWGQLCKRYRCNDQFLGTWKGWQWGQLGIIHYNRCLWVGADSKGLYLKTGPLFLFRLFHPPLQIPWSAIKSVEEHKYWWQSTVEIKLFDPDVRILLKLQALDEAHCFLENRLIEKKVSS